MKRLKKIIGSAILAMMLCMMMTTVAYAEENDSVWLRVADTSDGEGTDVTIITDTTLTSGLLTVTYDSSDLTYQGLTVNETYVAMHAVNSDREGVLLISWVAPEAYEAKEEPIALFQVKFSGTAEAGSMELTGEVYDEEGVNTVLDESATELYVDITAVVEAVAAVEALNEEDYAADSYAAAEEILAETLEEAKAVLKDPTATQEELDAAAKALHDVLEGLVDLTGLKEAVAAAESKDLTNATDGTAEAYREAIEAARTVLGDPAATKEDVAAAIDKLKEEEEDLVDGAGLRTLLRVASYKEEYKYTEKSYKNLKRAVEAAKEVMGDADATQKEVDQAASKLDKAIQQLKLLAAYGGSEGTATGDESNIVLPAMLAVAAIAVIAALVVMKKRGLAK